MGEPGTPPPSSVERWVSWAAFFSAIVLGWVLLWALGWSRGFGPIGSDGPAHAMTRYDPCETPGQAVLLLAGMVLTAVAAVKLITSAMKRGGWWQVGLWAGFILIADTLLMFQYMRFIAWTGPCLD